MRSAAAQTAYFSHKLSQSTAKALRFSAIWQALRIIDKRGDHIIPSARKQPLDRAEPMNGISANATYTEPELTMNKRKKEIRFMEEKLK